MLNRVLLEVRDLQIHFHLQEGVVKAVDGISYQLKQGEVLGLVGESGCGKTVSSLSILKLLEVPPAEYYGGEIIFEGRDLLKAGEKEMRSVRGRSISYDLPGADDLPQPLMSIGTQVGEVLIADHLMSPREARERAPSIF